MGGQVGVAKHHKVHKTDEAIGELADYREFEDRRLAQTRDGRIWLSLKWADDSWGRWIGQPGRRSAHTFELRCRRLALECV